jgi:GGDEF domain-containing protein
MKHVKPPKSDENVRRRKEIIPSKFLATVRHELRSPIVALEESIRQMLEKWGKTDPELLHYLHIIRNNTSRLSWLVKDLFDLSRLEAGRMSFRYKQENLNYVIDEVVANIQPCTKRKKIQLVWQAPNEPTLVFVDRERISQIVNNLLLNSFKFVHENGQVKIMLSKVKDHAHICIQDNGVGIDPSDQEKIFEKFVQMNASEMSEQRGGGMGLTIAKHLVESHRGKIWVESKLNEGSKFYFTLPLMTPQLETDILLRQWFEEASLHSENLGFIVFDVEPAGLPEDSPEMQERALDVLFRLVSNNIRAHDLCRWWHERKLIACLHSITRKDAELVEKRLWHVLSHQPFSRKLHLRSATIMYPEDGANLEQLVERCESKLAAFKEGPRQYELEKRQVA